MANDAFAPKLELVLKALVMSRGRLAADLGVNKSVVSRWLNGANAPTGHNLANLSALVAARRPGFTLLDWESDLEALAAKLGVAEPANDLPAAIAGFADWLPPVVLNEILTQTAARGEAYEGFWRTTRPSIEAPGRFVHDRILVRRRDGLLRFKMGVEDMRFSGLSLPMYTQVVGVAADQDQGIFVFSVFHGVLRHRADVMDGLTLTLQRVGGGTPVAGCCLMERVGLLSGDPEADDARHEELIRTRPTLAPEGSVPEELQRHLLRDAGAAAMAAGGAALLALPFAQSLSRGPRTQPTPFVD
jgi:transcriptional regulator with XRE-family HTH domain